ncbi:MAG TPA: DNA polymerase/3'-5' exonuclease PolX [Methanomicrobiales archaeon]|nr:DNA polymerase/3'-5' exonuclease PolX [Methanomicrobiales archaeon]
MALSNREVAERLRFMAQLLEVTGEEDVFKVRAYERAAKHLEELATPVSELDGKALLAIPGIGSRIAGKIAAILETGTFPELQELQGKIPESLPELLKLEGVGPKTVHTLWMKLGVRSVADLERAARQRRIRAVKGFGEKKESEFLKSIARHRAAGTRMTRDQADAVVAKVIPVLTPGTFEVAGSYRRGKSTVGDIDIAVAESPQAVNSRIRSVADEIIAAGSEKTSIRCLGRQVDLRFTEPESFGSMLLYLTGSKEFNIHLREIAIGKGLKLNEYGLEERAGDGLHTFADEASLFSFLGLPWFPPEIREDRGEIERALTGDLPPLVELKAVRGDLHVHTSATDGKMGLGELAAAGDELGYEYILVSDHTATLGVTHGLDAEGVTAQGKEIAKVNRDHRCQLLAGIEVDILADGSLGLPDRVLAGLDLVIASVHSGLSEEKDVMTRRILTAIANEHVDILGHPTGRLIPDRPPYEVDLERVIDAAKASGTALEINASPFRMDLDDPLIRKARDRGVKLSIGTDSHRKEELAHIRHGVTLARRGWCGPADLLNTMDRDALLGWAR